jgi:hypothetical protein
MAASDERGASSEEDMAPLVGRKSVPSKYQHHIGDGPVFRRSLLQKVLLLSLLLAICGAIGFAHHHSTVTGDIAAASTDRDYNPGFGPVANNLLPIPKPTPFVTAQRNEIASRTFENLIAAPSSIADLQRNFHIARQQLEHTLRRNYGKVYFDAIFLEHGRYNRGRIIFQSLQSAWDVLKRKLMIALLAAALSDNPASFVWAVGGDGQSTHGNLIDTETAAAYMEHSLIPIFQALRINLETRNYAMLNTPSGPEVALCLNEIFGDDDVDLLMWDFGGSDGNRTEYLSLYLHRAAMMKSHPIVVVNNLGTRYFADRKRILDELQDLVPSFYMSKHVLARALGAVPDSKALKFDQLQQLPKYVRNLKCTNDIEMGEPFCSEEKFNATVCPNRAYRNSWRNGWYVY